MAPPQKSSSSDNEYEFAGATGSSTDIDDFAWADDEPPAPAAQPAAAQATAAVKQGPIPFQGPASKGPKPPSSTAAAPQPAAPSASASPTPSAAATAAAAAPKPGVGPKAPAPPAKPAGPKPPLVRPPAPAPAAGAVPARQAAAAAGAGKPAQGKPAPASTAGATAVTPAAAASASASSPGSTPAKAAPGSAAAQAAPPSGGATAANAAVAPPARKPAPSAAAATAAGSASPEIAPVPGPEPPAAPAAAADDRAGSSSAGGGGGPGSSNSSGGGSGKGWGAWPASLGGLSSKLQQVALGAAKDLQELTASVHQVVAEVVAADDVTEVDRLAEYQPRPVRPPERAAGGAKPDAAPPAPVMASRDSTSHLAGPAAGSPSAAAGPGDLAGGVLLDPEEAKRQEVLQRLQGRDTQLESGLKVIDDQVDALAANAVKALGSLWGGLNTVAKTSWGLTTDITKKVEAAAKEMAKEVAVGLEEGASLVARAEKGLESVLGPRVTSGGGSQRSAADWEATFESCFELFGGTTATDELEELSSECAHICNNARAKLQQQQRDQIDAMLTKLVPLFDPTALLQQQEGPDALAAAAAAAVEAAGVEEATHDALDALYAPVVASCNKGKRKAAQLQSSAGPAAAAAAAAAAVADTATSPRQQRRSASPSGDTAAEQAEGGSSGGEAPQGLLEHDPQLLQQQRVCEALQEVLQAVRSAAVKNLAEVAAGQIMVLLTMAHSVAALPRYGKPLADGLEWPSEAEAVGGLIRGRVQEMVADTRELADAFAAVAAKVAAHMPPPAVASEATSPAGLAPTAAAAAGDAGRGSSKGGGEEKQDQQQQQQSPQQVLQQRAHAAASEVAADCQMALTHVRDSHGKLLYVVLLASLHRAGKEVAAAQPPQSSGAADTPKGQQQQQQQSQAEEAAGEGEGNAQ